MIKELAEREGRRLKALVDVITRDYGVDKEIAEKIVRVAHRYGTRYAKKYGEIFNV